MLWTSLSGSKSQASLCDVAIANLDSFSIAQKPTPDEEVLMKDWIDILVAFVNHDKSYGFGTTDVKQLKAITPAGSIEIQPDLRWDDLIAIGKVFAGDSLPTK